MAGGYLIAPDPAAPRLTRAAAGLDHDGREVDARVVGERPLVCMEDACRRNAVDKIAGWMALERVAPADKPLYTTGRLTSGMVIKTALMGIPALANRSIFTAGGVEIARQVGLTLIGRMRGRRFLRLAGEDRPVRDSDPAAAPEEPSRHRRKAADHAA